MGMYDTILVPCPECGTKEEFQSKSGECFLQVVELNECPIDILSDANRHSPYTCKCGTVFEVDLSTRTPKVVGNAQRVRFVGATHSRTD